MHYISCCVSGRSPDAEHDFRPCSLVWWQCLNHDSMIKGPVNVRVSCRFSATRRRMFTPVTSWHKMWSQGYTYLLWSDIRWWGKQFIRWVTANTKSRWQPRYPKYCKAPSLRCCKTDGCTDLKKHFWPSQSETLPKKQDTLYKLMTKPGNAQKTKCWMYRLP